MDEAGSGRETGVKAGGTPEPPVRSEVTGAAIDRERFERHLTRSEFYPYPGPRGHVTVIADTTARGLRSMVVRYRSPLPSGAAPNDEVCARLFVHEEVEQRKPVVLLHGLGVRRLAFWDPPAKALAARGFPTLLVCLPHLCERASADERPGRVYTSTHAETALPAYEQAVADTRAALDWLLSESPCAPRPAAEAAAPALVGISLGALLSVITAALEPRFGSVIPVLGGGDLDIIVFKGHYRTSVQEELDGANVTIENRRRARLLYDEYLDAVRKARHPLEVPAPFHFFLFDPLTFASSLRTRPVLMLNARLDPIIPRAAARQLWLELGCPEISWFWGTHWAGGPWKPYVSGKIARFLAGLGPGASRVPADTRAELILP